ncbi:unnamed protein product [Protopolystoma xenopodis]|uniref:Uncharacterized protein n=1 Tax=Protopolystoma xenopodis TaxID=117903 RepID=A0A3S5ARF6_9PLAT|nr:unnamed protein product [Protopolystoma xenopodis]
MRQSLGWCERYFATLHVSANQPSVAPTLPIASSCPRTAKRIRLSKPRHSHQASPGSVPELSHQEHAKPLGSSNSSLLDKPTLIDSNVDVDDRDDGEEDSEDDIPFPSVPGQTIAPVISSTLPSLLGTHRALLFFQTRSMLHLVEMMIRLVCIY